MTQSKQTQQNEQSQPPQNPSINEKGTTSIHKVWFKQCLRALIAMVVVVGILVIIFYLLPGADAVFNLNRFLFTHYGVFLVLRLGIYGVMSLVVLRIKKQVIGTPYYRSYCRTCALCGVMVVLNEVMLLIRVMGA